METTPTTLQSEGYDGAPIRLGKFSYVAPPLTLKSLRTLMPKITALSSVDTPSAENFDTFTELVFTTLKRNYPEITRDIVEDGLDLSNINEVITAILNASGLKAGNAAAATAP